MSLQNSNEGTDDLNEEIIGRLSSCLLPMAKRHECYSTLWKICCDLNDSGLLRNLMVCINSLAHSFFIFIFSRSLWEWFLCWKGLCVCVLYQFNRLFALPLKHRKLPWFFLEAFPLNGATIQNVYFEIIFYID